MSAGGSAMPSEGPAWRRVLAFQSGAMKEDPPSQTSRDEACSLPEAVHPVSARGLSAGPGTSGAPPVRDPETPCDASADLFADFFWHGTVKSSSGKRLSQSPATPAAGSPAPGPAKRRKVPPFSRSAPPAARGVRNSQSQGTAEADDSGDSDPEGGDGRERVASPAELAPAPRDAPLGSQAEVAAVAEESSSEEEAMDDADAAPDDLLLPPSARRQLRVPGHVGRYLRDYQIEGVAFLARRYLEGLGAILVDDMGLGKTLQVIAFLAGVHQHCQEEEEPFSVLLICPTSLKDNWIDEFEKWAKKGQASICVDKAEGKDLDNKINRIRNGRLHVLVVSLGLVRTYIQELAEVDFTAVVVDEAHKIKNMESKAFKACMKLRTPLRYALTGTPMPNRYEELYALVEWVTQGDNPLGDIKVFRDEISRPLREGFDARATQAQRARAEAVLHRVQNRIKRLLLKRSKDVVLRDVLPIKRDLFVLCPMSAVQTAAYERLLLSEDTQWVIDVVIRGVGKGGEMVMDPETKGPLWRSLHCCQCPNEDGKCNKHRPEGCEPKGLFQGCPQCLLFSTLDLMWRTANHLELIKANPVKDPPHKVATDRDVARMAFGEDLEAAGGTDRMQKFEFLMDSRQCGKLRVLDYLLRQFRDEGKKALVFSNSVRLLRIIEHFVIATYGANYLMLHGEVPEEARKQIVVKFNNNESVRILLVSKGVGSMGLNLTGAQRVVIFDPSWTADDDLQAMDRAYRMGQTQDVDVYRLVSKGTVEEVRYCRQIYKRQHADQILEGRKMDPLFKGYQREGGYQELTDRDKEAGGSLFGLKALLDGADRHFRHLRTGAQRYGHAGGTVAMEVGESQDDDVDRQGWVVQDLGVEIWPMEVDAVGAEGVGGSDDDGGGSMGTLRETQSSDAWDGDTGDESCGKSDGSDWHSGEWGSGGGGGGGGGSAEEGSADAESAWGDGGVADGAIGGVINGVAARVTEVGAVDGVTGGVIDGVSDCSGDVKGVRGARVIVIGSSSSDDTRGGDSAGEEGVRGAGEATATSAGAERGGSEGGSEGRGVGGSEGGSAGGSGGGNAGGNAGGSGDAIAGGDVGGSAGGGAGGGAQGASVGAGAAVGAPRVLGATGSTVPDAGPKVIKRKLAWT